MRVGVGYDLHRLVPTAEMAHIPIGGIPIPCQLKTEAHSDGDVLLHATVDAILGAVAMGDIGRWFPDTAPENRGRSSEEFVTFAIEKAFSVGWVVKQLDSIVMLETPRLSDHKEMIRQNLARLLNIELDCTSVKAKSGEGIGPIGLRKAIAAHVNVVLVERR